MTSSPFASPSAVPNPALATPSRLEPSPKNEVALTIPATFNFAVGVLLTQHQLYCWYLQKKLLGLIILISRVLLTSYLLF